MELALPSATAVPLIAKKRHRCRCREPPLESVSSCCKLPLLESLPGQPLHGSVTSYLRVDVVTAKVSKAVVQAAGDFEMRRKGLCETFGLWFCVLR
ncbi:uncharacterized protein DS421_9g265640 [Arachis hypogaea]|nr:uncharacterized protein DS421_9g265640 [Arachis hypogaea]